MQLTRFLAALVFIFGLLFSSVCSPAIAGATLITTSSISVVTGNGGTSGTFNSTGGNFIAVCTAYSIFQVPTVSDNKGNTWHALSAASDGGNQQGRLYYANGATVGSGHTVTVSGGSTFAGAVIAVFSGIASATPFEGTTTVNNNTSNTIQPGSVTPTTAQSFFATCLGTSYSTTPSINSGFTDVLHIDHIGGGSYGVDLAWKQSSSAENPTWTTTGGVITNVTTLQAFVPYTPSVSLFHSFPP